MSHTQGISLVFLVPFCLLNFPGSWYLIMNAFHFPFTFIPLIQSFVKICNFHTCFVLAQNAVLSFYYIMPSLQYHINETWVSCFAQTKRGMGREKSNMLTPFSLLLNHRKSKLHRKQMGGGRVCRSLLLMN